MRGVFTKAYIEAAVFADWPEDAPPGADWSPGTPHSMEQDAGAFYSAHEADVLRYGQGVAQAGHDLWLTRCGHGCGYWEQGDVVSQRLNAAAKALGDCELYLGDDGRVWS
jgi:hypothetical protein